MNEPSITVQLNVNCENYGNDYVEYVERSCVILEIEFDDIQDEVNFRESSVMCYILGAKPPLSVVEGSFR